MRSARARALIAVAALAAIVVLFIVFAGGDDDNDKSSNTTTAAQPTPSAGTTSEEPDVAAEKQITIRAGRPVGGVKKLDYKSGDQIRFVVTSDVADEVHVHGYDIAKHVQAGSSVRFSFPARLEGVFEAELENRKAPIAELRISP